MNQFDKAVSEKKTREARFAEKEPTIQGVLVGVDSATSAAVQNQPGRSWCQVYGDEESQPVPVLNRKVPATPGLRVIVRRVGSSYEVVDTDSSGSITDTDTWTGNSPVLPHADEHEIGGFDPLYIYMRAMTMLRCSVTGSGFKIAVPPTNYPTGQGSLSRFPGHNSFDLVSFQPASGEACLVLVYLDTELEILGAIAGDPAPDTPTIQPSKPAVPDNSIPSAYVRLSGDATKLTEADIYEDTRAFISPLIHNAARIRNLTVETGSPADGETLAWNASSSEIEWAHPAATIRVKNTSGTTAAAGDVGYIDHVGEYKTTTTASEANKLLCVVVTGGANNADITVARAGRRTVNYTGTAPGQGDYLVTSTTAGKAARQTYVSPEIFAVCVGNGAGGVVQALLLCNRVTLQVSASEDVIRINSHSGTDFTATIAAKSGANVEYTVTGGTFENSIKPVSSGELGKIVLHNTTRGTSALIDSVNTANTGTPADGTITLTATAPAGWQVGDSITTRSQTNTSTSGTGTYFFDIDLSSADNTIISPLAVAFRGEMLYADSAATSANAVSFLRHPFEADSTSKRSGLTILGASLRSHRRFIDIPLIQRKFCINCAAESTATATCYIRVSEVVLAAP